MFDYYSHHQCLMNLNRMFLLTLRQIPVHLCNHCCLATSSNIMCKQMVSLSVQICLESRISLAHSFTGSVIHISHWYILLLEQIQLYLSLSSFLHSLELGQVVGLTTYQYRRLPENNLFTTIYFGLSSLG
jgi:hypothetical protein